METVFGWIENVYRKLGLLDPDNLRSMGARRMLSTALDGVYLLGVGACIFENNVGFLQGYFAQEFPEARWSIVNTEVGALFLMFAGLLGLSQGDLGNLDRLISSQPVCRDQSEGICFACP
jgi:hypothetical protein